MAVSKRLRYEVLRRDGHTCRYCGRTAPEVTLTVDHVVPVALGGTDEPSNLVAACRDCNSGKSASSPDAQLVDDVAEDALRWSQALQAAAERMSADLTSRDARRAEFRAAWDRWHFESDGGAVPLPADWATSIDGFLRAGLPMSVLVDCIQIAMHAPRVAPENVFRYLCGIAWKRVGELHEATRETLVDSAVRTPHAPVLASEFVGELWGYMPYKLSNQVIAERAEQFEQDRAEDDDFERWAHWTTEERAALQMISDLSDEFSAADIAYRLLQKLTESARDEWMTKSREVFLANGEETPDIEEVGRFAAVMAFDFYARLADDHRDSEGKNF
ncbi:HNH endonuclease [Saccharopolyspora sp. NPDC050642]|uniref:HNH endonuclease n=1 Tax=Saccharopolyspora sp. NPDC050642 TaxID=3157099 RepID=UPI0033F5B210